MHLHLTESSALLGMQATAEAERAYWLSREKAAVKAPAEIDVHVFHNALGLMYPINWRCSEDGECETFMLAEMVCGNVTEIYARIGMSPVSARGKLINYCQMLPALRCVPSVTGWYRSLWKIA